MATDQDRLSQLDAAIAAQEALRSTLGDAVVDTTLAALRAQRAALQAEEAAASPQSATSSDQLLERLQSYLPRELAEKIRATGRIESERKEVTVVFADITGYTALTELLDPEEVASLTHEALKEMAEAVYQYEGYIDKFMGDAIMAVFGAPVTHEDDPERALRAALAMRERLEGFNRRWADRLAEPLTLHIGINTGTVVAGNVGTDLRLSYTVVGDTVNTAARLEAAARPGQILVSRDTYRLTSGAFTFQALEPIRVQGKREPLTVFELQRARVQPGKLRGLQGLSSALVGREQEMEQLESVLLALERGAGRIVFVTGEAGIGKSRLMADWRGRVGERALCLEGRAFSHTTSLAYGPFLDLLRAHAGIRDDDSEVQARTRLYSALDQLFPDSMEARALLANLLGMRTSAEEAAVLADLPGEGVRRRAFALVEQLFIRLASERPVVLVIEDVHWADTTSIELIEHLLPLTAQLPLAIVCVFRLHTGDAPSRLHARAAAAYAERFRHIPLSPLSREASLEMVEQLLSVQELPEALRTLIVSKAEGNPFFVEEVIRTLIERGALIRDEAGEGWVATLLMESVTVPDNLRGLLMARLDRLPEETKRVVQQAAVIGRIFLYRVLLQIAESTPGLDADLSHLEREELIREKARLPEVEYIFKHALTQEVAYQSLLASRRRELHRKVGEAMEVIFAERIGEFLSIIAEHFFRGEAWEKALDYFTRAGDAAARLYANSEARLHYERALEVLATLPESEENQRRRIDTTLNLVRAAYTSDPPERSLARLNEVEPLALALPAADGREGGDRLRLARIHYFKGRFNHMANAPLEAIRYYRQVLEVARELGDEELLAIPSSFIGRALTSQGHFGKAQALLAQAIAPLAKLGNWVDWIPTVSYVGVCLTARGDYAAGRAEGERALVRAIETNNPTAIALVHIYHCVIHLLGGDSDAVLASSQAATAVAERSGDRMVFYTGYAFQAWAESRKGLHEEAVRTMARSSEVAETLGGRLIIADWFAAARAEIALNAGRHAEAVTLAEEAVRFAEGVGGIFAQGLAHRTWAQALARVESEGWQEVESHLTASLAALEAGEARLEAARTHLAWGRLSREQGDEAGAREHLEQAAAQFEASGRTQEVEQTRSLLV